MCAVLHVGPPAHSVCLTQRKHILLTPQEWEAEEPMSTRSKLVLSIECVVAVHVLYPCVCVPC